MSILTSIAVQATSCFLAWSILYYILCILNSHRSSEWNCRVLTVSHATLITSLSYWCAFQTGPWPFDAIGEPSTPFQTLIQFVSIGYFLFDFIWCVYMGTEGLMMLFHHLMSILTMGFALFSGHSGSEIIASIFGLELTNPFLQLRWFLRETRQYQTTFAYMNDLVFMGLFFYLRLGPGSFLVYHTHLSSKPHIFIKAGGTGLYIVGVIWSVLILKFARRRFFGKKK